MGVMKWVSEGMREEREVELGGGKGGMRLLASKLARPAMGYSCCVMQVRPSVFCSAGSS